MDKIRKALASERPSSPSYERLNPESNGHTDEESQPLGKKSPTFSWLEYSIFLLLGVSMLWAWNMFLAASPYFQHRFASSAYLLTHFPAYITSVSTLTNLVSVTLLTRLQRSASYPKRIILSLILNIIAFTLLAISTALFRSISPEAYFAFLIFMVFTASLATGLCQNGVFAYVSGFGIPEYTQAIMTGQAIAGVLPCVAQIVSVLSVTESSNKEIESSPSQENPKSAFAYFLTATAVSVLTLFAFAYLRRSHSSSLAIKTAAASEDTPSSALEDADGEDDDDDAHNDHSQQRKIISLWTLFKKLQYLAIAVFLCFAITMFFPIFTQQILSVHSPSSSSSRLYEPAVFIPLAFLLWNIGDLLGRLLTGVPALKKLVHHPKWLLFISVARSIWIPLYMSCNVKGRGAAVQSDGFYLIVVQLLFGLSNGFVGSSCMMGAGKWVEEEEREAAGGFMGMMLVGGLGVGSLLSFVAA
ncbi:MAG: hypothetical protein Q9220_004809 [cf. Caloplaca sp. 1 TL-2023]